MRHQLVAAIAAASVCLLVVGVALQERAGRSPAAMLASGLYYTPYPAPGPYQYGCALRVGCGPRASTPRAMRPPLSLGLGTCLRALLRLTDAFSRCVMCQICCWLRWQLPIRWRLRRL